jgi:hypothetical protein
MNDYTNKNSIASTISSFTESLEQWVLEPNEALNKTPSGFINILSSTLGKLNAYSYLDMLMSKAEINQSTAIRMKSLLQHLRSDMISSIYGTPSSITFILSYPEEELIKKAVPVSFGASKLTLNRNAKISIPEKPEFTFDYDIDIFVNRYDINNETKYSIYAVHNSDNIESVKIFPLANPFIASRNDIIIDGKRHFSMYINAKQYSRHVETFELSGENKNISITYFNHLIGFTVLYKGLSDTKWINIETHPEGSKNASGMTYSITEINQVKTVELKFSKISSSFAPVNGTLKVIVFTTMGKDGNFTIPELGINESLDGLTMDIEQDTSNVYEEALISLIPTGSLNELSATGGKDALSLEEVRRLVINRSMNTIITPTSLEMAAAEAGFTVQEMRHDLLEWKYTLTKSLTDSLGNVIPSSTIDVFFLYSELAVNGNANSRTISPYDIYRYDSKDREYRYIPLAKLDSYTDYLERYKKSLGNDYLFPYFLQIQDGQSIAIEPYDLSINQIRTTEFVYISENILDKMSIMYAEFIRNPLDTELVSIRDSNNILGNFYSVVFHVFTSDVIIDHLMNIGANEKPFIKFKLIVKNKTDASRYVVDALPSHYEFDTKNNTIQCSAFLETNNSLLSNNRICVINNSLVKIPYSTSSYPFYYIDEEIDVEIVVIFKGDAANKNPSSYDSYLSPEETMDNYYIGVIYKIDNVSLAKNVKEHVSLTTDVKLTQPVYKIADADIPDVYEENVYKEENGNYVTVNETLNLADGSKQTMNNFVVLHKKGDIKKELDGRVGTFDIMNQNSIWSNDASSEGVYNDGDILGGNSIYCSVKTNDGLIIFGGKEGRVGCYDVNRDAWHSYNTGLTYRDGSSSSFIVKSNGDPMGKEDIKTMLVVQVKRSAGMEGSASPQQVNLLVVAGEGGRVASCDLSTGEWRHYDGSRGNDIASVYNNGSAMGTSAIYCSTYYEDEFDVYKNMLLFAGGDGRICCYNIKSGIWFSYDSNSSNPDIIINDGHSMGYKAILTMTNYRNEILFLAGVLGHVCSCNLGSKTFIDFDTTGAGMHNDGEIVGNASIYASAYINAIYVAAGEGGHVASYDITNGAWTAFDQGGFSSDGAESNYKNINAIDSYDNYYIIFGCDEGVVSSYNILSNTWTPYNDSSGICNTGSFIKNSISSIIKHNSIVYFTGKLGNIVYKYHAGDIMTDEDGNFIVEKPSELQGVIKGLPVYNRIYGVKSSYFNIVKSYNNMIDSIKSLASNFPQGCRLAFGINNTSGHSNTFKFLNTKTKEEEYLDNLSLSLSLGVKLDDNVSIEDKKYLVNEIKTEIISYIKDIQKSTADTVIRLNFNMMLDEIKGKVPNIVYFELYSINSYDANICQTVFYKKDLLKNSIAPKEYLSVRNNVDEDASDISNQIVVFTPDIDINLL